LKQDMLMPKESQSKSSDPMKTSSIFSGISSITNPLTNSLSESDPLGKSAKDPGSKLDTGKAPVLRGAIQYFPRAIRYLAQISEIGSRKYSWKGWEKVPDGINRYGDALMRHLLAEEIEGSLDMDTGCLHAAQVAWNAMARLELMLRDGTQSGPKS